MQLVVVMHSRCGCNYIVGGGDDGVVGGVGGVGGEDYFVGFCFFYNFLLYYFRACYGLVTSIRFDSFLM